MKISTAPHIIGSTNFMRDPHSVSSLAKRPQSTDPVKVKVRQFHLIMHSNVIIT